VPQTIAIVNRANRKTRGIVGSLSCVRSHVKGSGWPVPAGRLPSLLFPVPPEHD
jgi:hypothetical protein